MLCGVSDWERRGEGDGEGLVEVGTGDDGVEGFRVGTFHDIGSSFMVDEISLYGDGGNWKIFVEDENGEGEGEWKEGEGG